MALAVCLVDFAAGLGIELTGIEALGEGVADFVGVGGDIGWVNEGDVAGLLANATHEPVSQFRLEDVT